MTIEIPDNVLAAIVAFVELQRTNFPDDTDFLVNGLPVIEAWLEGLGVRLKPHPEPVLPPLDTEEA